MNFLELVKARYSARKYANRPVEAEKLDYIMECVRFAPSAVNFQPWRFRIVTDEAVLKTLYSCYKREWLATAPCITSSPKRALFRQTAIALIVKSRRF